MIDNIIPLRSVVNAEAKEEVSATPPASLDIGTVRILAAQKDPVLCYRLLAANIAMDPAARSALYRVIATDSWISWRCFRSSLPRNVHDHVALDEASRSCRRAVTLGIALLSAISIACAAILYLT